MKKRFNQKLEAAFIIEQECKLSLEVDFLSHDEMIMSKLIIIWLIGAKQEH